MSLGLTPSSADLYRSTRELCEPTLQRQRDPAWRARYGATRAKVERKIAT